MPRFSIFTPLGHLRFSRIPPLGKRLFDAGAASLGGGKPGTYALTGRTFAWLYAWSMTLGTVAVFQERAGQQWDPVRVTDLLELQERERGSIPQAGWTIGQRRAQLARMRRLIHQRHGITCVAVNLEIFTTPQQRSSSAVSRAGTCARRGGRYCCAEDRGGFFCSVLLCSALCRNGA